MRKKKQTMEIFRDGTGRLVVYLNGYRIAGQKPWGGVGDALATIVTDRETVQDALKHGTWIKKEK